jgi:hypothetical protein
MVDFDRIAHLVEVEHKVKLTNVAEKLIQDLDKEMNGLQICQLIVICIHARAKEQSGVAAIHDLAAATELDEVGLMLLVPGCHQAVDLAFEFDLFVVVVR